ncbi:hypothetical protein N802_14615 [Knoellia sinensis KCTC 19936]|uniref:DUF4349 domain-containing protein n=1 Tax=Knoellia sinensis KCTC 19936 TaxID=1385520 RepID=A0A0A0J9F4_9MICO|nr:DUF4349 domain-containing protein [Knoellia sinensis]KGN33404.1 hypothetical protein N802_14615 [Knoellia sinensis KCTC 19936]
MSTLTTRPTGMLRRRLIGAALAGFLCLALTACAGSANDSADSSAGTAVEDGSAAKTGGDADRAVGAVSSEQARASVGQKLVRRANLQLKVDSLTESAQRIRAIAAQQSGAVLTEELYSGEAGRDTSGSITISVPAGSLDATIALIEKVGDVQFRTSSSEDVTGTYVDTEARVKSMTASVARIRDLLSKASTVNDLVALENELSQRQAELDALTAQLANLKDSVSMSPISISLSTDDFEPVSAGGFLSGLKSGWSAFMTSMSVLVTVIGAVLPFAVATGLVAAPLVWWMRRRRSARPAFGAPVTQPAGPSGPVPPPSAG